MYDCIYLFKTSEIYTAILLITVIFVVLSVGFVIFMVNYKLKQGLHLKETKVLVAEYEKQLMQSQIEVQEMTMEDLGRELHDNVGQLLSSTKLLLGVTQRSISEVPDTLSLALETLDIAIIDLRALTKSLDKEWLAQFDLVTNLETEISRINTAKEILIEFTHPGKLPMEAKAQIVLFRIVQEALQNAIKHADAANIMLNISIHQNRILLDIKDNGKGVKGTQLKSGLGIRNMKHRTKLLGGMIEWVSSTGGSEVKIELPIKEITYEN